MRRTSKPVKAPTIDRLPRGHAARAIVVIGMHRSGTSALGGSLARLGVDFGERLAAPQPDNEKGFWEHPEIVALHNKLLKQLGSAWDDDAPLPLGWAEREGASDIQASLAAVVVRDFGNKTLFGFKDPRISRLVPLWLPLFERLEIEPYFMLMVRHPWEVAESLRRRNGITHAKSALLWLRYTLEAESGTNGKPRMIVSYEQALDDRGALFARISKELKLPHRSVESIERDLGGFLHQSLRHHRVNEDDQKSVVSIPAIALEVYQALLDNSTGVETSKRIAELTEQFERSSALFQPRLEEATVRLRQEIETLGSRHQQENEEKTKQLLRFQADAQERAKHVAILQRENDQRAQVIERLGSQRQQENEEKTKQVLHFQADAQERAKHVAILQRENDQRAQVIERLKSKIEQAEDRLARASKDLLDAQWEALTLRATLLKETEFAETPSARILALENRAEVAESDREHLRGIVIALQRDLAMERDASQASQNEALAALAQLKASEDQLKAATQDLRLEQKRLRRVKESVVGKLILPFGRAQKNLRNLTASPDQ